MRKYLPDYRKEERKLLNQGKAVFGWKTPKQKLNEKKVN
jgi:hypothetical protein